MKHPKDGAAERSFFLAGSSEMVRGWGLSPCALKRETPFLKNTHF